MKPTDRKDPAPLLYPLLCCVMVNLYAAFVHLPWLLVLAVPVYIWILCCSGIFGLPGNNKRLKLCHHGAVLLLSFVISLTASLVWQGILAFLVLPQDPWILFGSLILCASLETLMFWVGIICVYATSVQLGIKHRVVGLVCGMIPVVNLLVLNHILKIVFREIRVEREKEALNRSRKDQQICATKYPVLMVHGVFFRDSRYFNYWGRIPKELEDNGCRVYYGNQQSAASIEESARELSCRIKELVQELGCEKINIIAHSKGGLDCRCALAQPEIAQYVASLTTINTPHQGCLFAQCLLEKASPQIKNKVATAYNKTLRALGDSSPDFLTAITQLTATYCAEFNRNHPLPEGVFCQSVGSVLPKARGGKFPLNFSQHIVTYYDGENDGLVSERSCHWGERYTCVRPTTDRGISHGDMIDLNRENFPGFDVREFYVNLVSDLKERGF